MGNQIIADKKGRPISATISIVLAVLTLGYRLPAAVDGGGDAWQVQPRRDPRAQHPARLDGHRVDRRPGHGVRRAPCRRGPRDARLMAEPISPMAGFGGPPRPDFAVRVPNQVPLERAVELFEFASRRTSGRS